ncbi:SLC13 family permease [Kistimonas asteriae]|uniref:SLC13 family permease n=1 Tax=Kistimonas asteriae TaxID=517724 RepID=UPI001BAB8875|nr:SLC13 family permease [Kistimonas asteriae]
METYSQLMPWINGSVLVLVLAALISNLWRAGQIFAMALLYFLFTGQLAVGEALANFVNPVLMTLVLLLLVSIVLEKNRFIEMATRHALDCGYRTALLRLCTMTAFLSSMLNNTAIVAAFMGKVAGQKQHAASKLLIPLSYSAIAGGMLTLIGTSTNLIINSFVVNAGLEPLEFGDFFKIGAPVVMAVLFVLIATGQYILPDSTQSSESYNKFLMEARVEEGSPLVGKSIKENGFRDLESIFLVEMWREGRLITPVRPNRRIRANDILIFNGDPNFISELDRFSGLALLTEEERIPVGNLTEVVIASGSDLARKFVRNLGLRIRYDAAVVALSRGNQELTGKLSNVRLQVGDRLLLATGEDFRVLSEETTDFHILREHVASGSLDTRSSVISISLFLFALAGSIMGLFPLLEGLIGIFIIYLLADYTRLEELRNRIPFELIAVIGSALGIAQVFTNDGTVHAIAQNAAVYLQDFQPWVVMAGLFILTMVLTEVVTNNVAAALSFPLALGLAQVLGVDPGAFIMTIAFAASCSFMTPVGYQTNLMVYSAGNYQLTDYLRAGFPVMLVYACVSISMISWFYLY